MPRASWLLARVFGGLIKNTNEKANAVDSVVSDAQDDIVNHIHHHVEDIEATQAQHTASLAAITAATAALTTAVSSITTIVTSINSKATGLVNGQVTLQSKIDANAVLLNDIRNICNTILDEVSH